MSFPPIVHRELRVSSRRWSTFLIRAAVGLLALVLAMPGLFFGWLTGGGSGAGQGAFSLLSNYIFVIALLGGVFITADCLSSEKRDGTLGLLFLTDLRGYDIVLGKFAALGLHSIYAMLAVFPVLALPLLTGGVSGGEFWRVSLALINLLFVSLSLGMAVSAACREAGRAYFVTLMSLVLLVVALPLSVSLAKTCGAPAWIGYLVWMNPGHGFSVAQSMTTPAAANEYWISLGISHALAWGFLALAGLIVPNSWQDREEKGGQSSWMAWVVGDRIARLFRSQRSPDCLDKNPVLWLMGERPVVRILLWSLAGFWAVCVVAACIFLGAERTSGMVFGISIAVMLIFAVILIEHSCRFWVEARQNGSLETLLAVPLQSGAILSSHWASIRRHFLWPLMIVLGTATLPTWVIVGSEVLKRQSSGDRLAGSLFLYVYMGAVICWFLATFIAIGYTGMWFALKLRRPHFASGLTLLCVVVLPMMLCWMGFGVILVCIFLPMSFLQSNLRGMILQQYAPVPKSASSARH